MPLEFFTATWQPAGELVNETGHDDLETMDAQLLNSRASGRTASDFTILLNKGGVCPHIFCLLLQQAQLLGLMTILLLIFYVNPKKIILYSSPENQDESALLTKFLPI